MASQLDALAGVGPMRRKQLLLKFGSVDRIRAASVEDLAEVVPLKVAQKIKDAL
jgi:excinuclease ABC subunit C